MPWEVSTQALLFNIKLFCFAELQIMKEKSKPAPKKGMPSYIYLCLHYLSDKCNMLKCFATF